MATGFARALTRENSVPGQLTRKGMSSLSWGSARPPPDASRRPQRTNNTGPPGTRLRAPPPPSSILHRRFLQPPTQPPLPTEERRGGGEEEEEAAGLLNAKAARGPTAATSPSGDPATPPLPAWATRHRFRGGRHINIRGRRDVRLRKPGHWSGLSCLPQPQFRGGIECSGLPGEDARRLGLGQVFPAEKWRHKESVSPRDGGLSLPPPVWLSGGWAVV